MIFLGPKRNFLLKQIFSISENLLNQRTKRRFRNIMKFRLEIFTFFKFLKWPNLHTLLRPCIPNFKPNIRVGFWVGMSFSRFLNLILTSFFVIFGKFGIEQFPKFLEIPNIRKTLFPNFSKRFDPKTGFFDSKTGFFVRFQILPSFIWNFCNKVRNLNCRTFFQTFSQKFCEFENSGFFPKKFRPSITEHFQNSRKWKVWKILSNAGPYTLLVFEFDFIHCLSCFLLDNLLYWMIQINYL